MQPIKSMKQDIGHFVGRSLRGISDAFPLIAIPMIIVGAYATIVGATAFLMPLFGRVPSSPEQVWSLMAASFLAGFVCQLNRDESVQLEGRKMPQIDDGRLRMWLGLALFALSLSFGGSFSLRIPDLVDALPCALLAWGIYVLTVQMPWSSYDRLAAARRLAKGHSFCRYHVESQFDHDAAWERLGTFDDVTNLDKAYDLMKSEVAKGIYCEVRIVQEAGRWEPFASSH